MQAIISLNIYLDELKREVLGNTGLDNEISLLIGLMNNYM